MFIERSIMLSVYVSGGGRLHTKAECRASRKAGAPKNCVIHKPSLHKLTGSAQILRSNALIEDQCKHGTGHPNPDSVAYLHWNWERMTWHSDDDYSIHGCCGCCGPIEEEAREIRLS